MLPWQPFLDFYIRGAHWRHLKNTTEPSMCGSDAALCQITLTTCFEETVRQWCGLHHLGHIPHPSLSEANLNHQQYLLLLILYLARHSISNLA